MNNNNNINNNDRLISKDTTDVKLVFPIKSYRDAEASKNG